jgi:hypothetical protein
MPMAMASDKVWVKMERKEEFMRHFLRKNDLRVMCG